jgi:DNA polymerase-3 subunit delta
MLISDVSSLKKQRSRLYLLAIPDDYERQKTIKTLLTQLVFDGSSPLFFYGSEMEIGEVSDALQSPSLFGGESVVVIDEVEKIGKKELQILSSILQGSFSGYLILAARLKTSLFSLIEKSGVVLDLTEEKPWEKERRILEQIHLKAQNGGKRLSSDVAPLLFEKLGFDLALLDQEMDKLICFVGDRPTIERADVFRLTPTSRQETLWKMAEEIVWEKGQNKVTESFYAMIPALRSQLQMGLKIASLHQSGLPQEKWSEYLSKVWPKTLEKRKSQALKLGSSYFSKGLGALFEVEKLSRTDSSQEEALLDFFRMSLTHHVSR